MTGLLRQVSATQPDVLISDIRMPPTFRDEGLVAAEQVMREHPEVRVLILSQYVDSDYAIKLLRDHPSGIGYLLKDRVGDLEDLVHALHEVCSGGSVVDPQIVDALVRRRSRGSASPLAALSPRELDVLREMALGRTNAGIERALHLSSSTVEKHVNAIFTKLGLSEAPVHRRVVAVLAFLENAPGLEQPG